MVFTVQDLIEMVMYLDSLYDDPYYYINYDGSRDTFYYEARECEILKRKYLNLLDKMFQE